MSSINGRVFSLVMALSWTAGLVGCDSNTYDLELRPEGDSLARELTCTRGHKKDGKQVLTEFPDKELERFNSLYEDHSTSEEGKKHHFQGTFKARTPDDIGGSGWYLRWESDLGTVSGYVERFRGNDDLTVKLERWQDAVNRTVDLLIGWLEIELGEEPNFDHLRIFLDESFRRDLHNISLYIFSLTSVDEPNALNLKSTTVRIGQMLIERNYFAPEQFPELSRALEDSTRRKNPERLLSFLQRFLSEKMKMETREAIPDSLAFLKSEKRLIQSLESFLKTTDEYQEKHQQWLLEKKSDPEASKPKTLDVLTEPLVNALLRSFITSGDRVNVSLDISQEPYRTNGEWEAEEKRVKWSQSIARRDDAGSWHMPTVLYAFWSEPNEESQRKVFGKVVLRGKSLEDYVRWYLGLTEPERHQWDVFLSTLTPETVGAQLEQFRFEGEPAPNEKPSQDNSLLSTVPRKLLSIENSAEHIEEGAP